VNRKLYWIGIVLTAVGAAVAIWLLDPSKALFPGLLTLFSFYLIWITQDSRLRRENPDVLVHVGSIGLISKSDCQGCKYLVCVSNPGVLAGSLTKIDWLKDKKTDSMAKWHWQSLYPVLGSRDGVASRSELPAPLLPRGLIALYTPGPSNPRPDNGYLSLTFQFGGYKERTIKWRVEPLKSEEKAGEDESKAS
jgi:hypothetical protein